MVEPFGVILKVSGSSVITAIVSYDLLSLDPHLDNFNLSEANRSLPL